MHCLCTIPDSEKVKANSYCNLISCFSVFLLGWTSQSIQPMCPHQAELADHLAALPVVQVAVPRGRGSISPKQWKNTVSRAQVRAMLDRLVPREASILRLLIQKANSSNSKTQHQRYALFYINCPNLKWMQDFMHAFHILIRGAYLKAVFRRLNSVSGYWHTITANHLVRWG